MKQILPRNPEMSEPAKQSRFNPYQPPVEKRIRGYWPRFFSAIGMARREYRRGMRQSNVGVFREILAWLFALGLLLAGLEMLGLLTYKVVIEILKKLI